MGPEVILGLGWSLRAAFVGGSVPCPVHPASKSARRKVESALIIWESPMEAG